MKEKRSELKLQQDGCSVSVASENILDETTLTTAIIKMNDLIKIMNKAGTDKDTREVVPTPATPYNEQTNLSTTPIKYKDFAIRERVPNNVVDVNTLKIDKANGQASMIRCPDCGQSHSAIIYVSDIENYLMVYSSETKEFEFVGDKMDMTEAENIKLKNKEKKLEFYEDLQELLKNRKTNQDICVDDQTMIYCPVCHCDERFNVWKVAYYSPLSYFETENPCRVCGGETLEQINKQSNERCANYKCESCGFKEEKKLENSEL